MKKYDKADIMKRAHEIRKSEGVTMGEALRAAWGEAKKGEPVKTALDAQTALLRATQTAIERKMSYEAAQKITDVAKAVRMEANREAIEDTFGIEIKCSRVSGYYIANGEDLEGDSVRQWLLRLTELTAF